MDFYIVLGVQHGATEAEIRRAYRRLARRYHPDINPGDRAAELRFRQILDAYETLIDPARRSRYDAGQGTDERSVRPKGGFEGFDFSIEGMDYSATFGDLFAEVLGERHDRPPTPRRGADLHVEMPIGFAESLMGGSRTLTLTRRIGCRACAGAGRARASSGACRECEGRGAVRAVRGHMIFSRRCSGCGGSGRRRPMPCDRCSGLGLETRTDTVRVRIPPGVRDGERLRVPDQGHGGVGGGPMGDLYVDVKVAPHALFRREGDDLHTVVRVAPHEAALGARIAVETLDGVAELRVPPGCQSGQRLRLRGQGAPSTARDTRGDLVVELRIALPKLLDERSKELLREFGRINTEPVRGQGAW
jgi:molecular chaperone DnaJ